MPLPMVALPCGSRSTSSTRRFVAPRLAARLTLVVVLPTPPFWFVIARMRAIASSGVARCSTRWRSASSPGTASGMTFRTRYSRRQLRELLVRMHAFHRDEHAAGARRAGRRA